QVGAEIVWPDVAQESTRDEAVEDDIRHVLVDIPQFGCLRHCEPLPWHLEILALHPGLEIADSRLLFSCTGHTHCLMQQGPSADAYAHAAAVAPGRISRFYTAPDLD